MFGCITFHPQTLCWRSGRQQQICQVWLWTCHRCTSGSYCASIIYVLRTKVEQWGCDNQQQDSGYHHKNTLPQNVNVGCEIWWTNTPSHKFAVSRVRKCKWSVQDKHVATSEFFIQLAARSAATPLWHLGCFSMSVTVFTCHIWSSPPWFPPTPPPKGGIRHTYAAMYRYNYMFVLIYVCMPVCLSVCLLVCKYVRVPARSTCHCFCVCTQRYYMYT